MSVNIEWMTDAACTQTDPEVFFPTQPGIPGQREVERAVLICRSCPVIVQCKEYARKFARGNGVWGGEYKGRHAPRSTGLLKESPKDRLRRAQALLDDAHALLDDAVDDLVEEDSPVHGTDAAYKAHTRRGEKACVACLQAHRLAHTIRRERREA
jgi:WhiB family redox-sensing transcriptional regulator